MKDIDKRVLGYLKPIEYGYYSDSYLVNCNKHQKEYWLDSRLQKVREWVEGNGGKFMRLTEKKIVGNRKGFIVRIIFPCYGVRDMKNIMAKLYNKNSGGDYENIYY